VPLVVRTWNLFHGNSVPPGRRAFLREEVELVTADDPDVVCLQEIPVWALRRLAGWSGMQAVRAIARKPRVGSAGLGRLITGIDHGRLRSAVTGEADAILVASRFSTSAERMAVVNESGLRRIVHGVRLDDDVFVANFHTTGDEQLRRVTDFVADEARTIVAGDANLLPAPGTAYDVFRERGFSEPRPGSIDQILVRGLPASAPVVWPEERRRVAGRLLSDHAPVELRVG
jgi:endonuclease/exonuclease/phosphatase family metal-dependent hydrolase